MPLDLSDSEWSYGGGALMETHSEPRAEVAPTVVVAAEDDLLRQRLEGLLPDEGYRVIDAADGGEALDYVRLARRDRRIREAQLLVAQAQMSGVDGLELLERLRSEGETAPVLLLVPARDGGTWRAAHRLGATPLTLPVSARRLAEAVRQLLGR